MQNLTLLKVYFIIYLVSCFIFVLANYKLIVYEDSITILFMTQLILIGLVGLLVDWILKRVLKNKKVFNGIELLIIVIFTITVWNEFQ